MTVTEHIRARLLSCLRKPAPSLETLKQTEWCPEFERLRLNRLVIGALRYGLLSDKSKPQYNRIASIRRRLDAYEKDKNAEHLVDTANLAMLEFVEGDHLGVNASDDGEHTQAKS